HRCRIHVQLTRVPDLDLASAFRRNGTVVEHPVRLALLDGGNRGIHADPELPDDLVRITVGLGRVRPLVKLRVAYELELSPSPVSLDPVWPGRRSRPCVEASIRRSNRYEIGRGQ